MPYMTPSGSAESYKSKLPSSQVGRIAHTDGRACFEGSDELPKEEGCNDCNPVSVEESEGTTEVSEIHDPVCIPVYAGTPGRQPGQLSQR